MESTRADPETVAEHQLMAGVIDMPGVVTGCAVRHLHRLMVVRAVDRHLSTRDVLRGQA